MVDFSIQSIAALPSKPKTLVEDPTAAPPAERSFGQWLNQSINTVNRMQQAADASAVKLTTGESKDIHNTMITMQKADIAMSLTMEVRNKIISAYDEIKRMQF